jgi:hypothetical protein
MPRLIEKGDEMPRTPISDKRGRIIGTDVLDPAAELLVPG